MKDRIVQFLAAEKISPAEFADKIGVQRSSMSHILNGRNHPSASFIQKMLHAYPLLNSRWLLIGEGKMQVGVESVTPVVLQEVPAGMPPGGEDAVNPAGAASLGTSGNQEQVVPETRYQENPAIAEPAIATKHVASPGEEVATAFQTDNLQTDNNKAAESLHQAMITHAAESEIEQVLFFYTDKTFKVYRPS